MYSLHHMPDGTYTFIHIDNAIIHYMPLQYVKAFMEEISGFKTDEINKALDEMHKSGDNIAEFGINRHFTITKRANYQDC